MDKFFSVKNTPKGKVINIMFFKIKLNKPHRENYNENINKLEKEVNQIKNILLDSQSRTSAMNLFSHQELIIDLYLDFLYYKNKNIPFDIENIFKNSQSVNISCWKQNPGCIFDNLPFLFNLKTYSITSSNDKKYADCYCMWGTQPFNGNLEIIKKAHYDNNPLLILEGGFLSNIESWSYHNKITPYNQTISFIIDDIAPYYDARKENRLEQMLNDSTLKLTSEQLTRAEKVITKIIENHLTKYNHQPIYTPNIGNKGRKKVLVVDQTYGDMSIVKGCANEKTFEEMLNAAIKENPNADIIIKTHPDVISGAKGYYSSYKEHDNIYLFRQEINPISLLKYVDKVYVCTSQLGFEALLCNKEVHVFGMPFYAGWGITIDKLQNQRRKNKRSLLEIFYFTYIIYTHYVSPITQKKCEIETAIEYLITMREKFFKERK